jgi:hypothetical protein
MTAFTVTLITSVLEITNTAWGVDWPAARDGVQITLAAITPILVWFMPHLKKRWGENPDVG